ncbi:MAG: glycosyltransferase family 2 protein [Candidatus Hodarchaeales archaeon]
MDIQLGMLLWVFSGAFYLLCTLYYILETMPAYFRHRRSFLNPSVPTDAEIKLLVDLNANQFPKIKFQITTKGNEADVVKRGINSIARLATNNPLFLEHIELLVVTDEPRERLIFTQHYRKLNIRFPADVLVVPKDYQTPNETTMKARSLQYSNDYRKSKIRSKIKEKSFIFYFDAESTIEEEDFRRIIHSVLTSPEKKIFEGPICYPHKYFQANIFSRQMEATRPFHCHHCVEVMKNPPPIHLHGSNLLVEEELVNEVGWDFGPVLAEDLVFGLTVYSKYGSDLFAWHGGQINEQPPFSIRSSINARLRWITGAWEAISLFKAEDISELSWPLLRLKIRILVHSLTFFAAFFFLFSILIFLFPQLLFLFKIDYENLPLSFGIIQFLVAYILFLPGTIFWIFGIVNGISKNIQPLNLPWKYRMVEYVKLLIVTPVAGAIESFCALYATLRWFIGKPYKTWSVTAK